MADLFDKIANKRHEKVIKYTDLNGKEQERKVEFKDAGWRVNTKLADMMQRGDGHIDLANMYNLLMQRVIVGQISFAMEDKQLKEASPDALKKSITVKIDGKDKTLHLIFPGFQRMADISGTAAKNNGDSDITALADKLINHVFRDAKDNKLPESFFDELSMGDFMNLINETMNYLTGVFNFDGYATVMEQAITFLTETSK